MVVLCIVVVGILFFSRSLSIKMPLSKDNTKNSSSLKNYKKSTDTTPRDNRKTIEAESVNHKTLNMNNGDGIVQKKIVVIPSIDYKQLDKNYELKKLMDLRKKSLGIKKSLDLIVKSNEEFKIDGIKISMRDILEKAFMKKGEILKEKIEPSGAVLPQEIEEYGIYVVQPGDNIWNIHFNILKEFYENRGVEVSSKADEPVLLGKSSGVGKILKFSETMVIIYNFVDKIVVSNIDLLEPLSKIVIYNMGEVFSLLFEVNYENIDRIQFDGTNIWVPAKSND
jgi:hypothetical protein